MFLFIPLAWRSTKITAVCQEFVRRKKRLLSFYSAEVLDYEWRTHQELNLKPSDP
jgi:hypothetical protein